MHWVLILGFQFGNPTANAYTYPTESACVMDGHNLLIAGSQAYAKNHNVQHVTRFRCMLAWRD